MALNFRISNVAAKALADTFDDQVNIGSTAAAIDVRTGAQPADPDTAATGTSLATLTMSDPAFGNALHTPRDLFANRETVLATGVRAEKETEKRRGRRISKS